VPTVHQSARVKYPVRQLRQILLARPQGHPESTLGVLPALVCAVISARRASNCSLLIGASSLRYRTMAASLRRERVFLYVEAADDGAADRAVVRWLALSFPYWHRVTSTSCLPSRRRRIETTR
jgi:hypothetical protein